MIFLIFVLQLLKFMEENSVAYCDRFLKVLVHMSGGGNVWRILFRALFLACNRYIM